MYKTLALLCVLCLVLTEARPKWQYLPELPGYVPVYIQNGDTPLEEINPDLAEAFHALPSGRSVGKQVDAAPEPMDKDVIKYVELQETSAAETNEHYSPENIKSEERR